MRKLNEPKDARLGLGCVKQEAQLLLRNSRSYGNNYLSKIPVSLKQKRRGIFCETTLMTDNAADRQ